jgi:hypothetical protein
MTDEQMNEFLESIGGLESGYYVDREPITNSNFFEFNNGWFQLIKELIEDLIVLGWDKQICQAKEKFGGLRFYINAGSDAIFDRISKAERDSYEICEDCGEKGEMRKDLGWYLTLCDKHYEEHKAKRNK